MKDEIFTKKEIGLLEALMTHNKTSKMTAFKFLNLLKVLNESSSEKQSESITRKNIRKLLDCKLISEGIKSNRYKTYYITQKGLDFLNGLLEDAERGNINE